MQRNELILLLTLLLCSLTGISQDLTGKELLAKAIAYHDPGNNWNSFNDTLNVRLDLADKTSRLSKVRIDLPAEFFELDMINTDQKTTYSIVKGRCKTSVQDSTSLRRTPCETAQLYKDYYTYLYGLPMKLTDPGTLIDDKVERKTFKGKEYLVLKATYDEAVGSDVWYFYFDPKTYAMEIYQFYKGDPNGVGKDTGEYILLSEMKTVSGIKMPRVRAWYYNKDDGYLGTDILE